MTLTKKGEKLAPAPERRPAPASWGLASRPGAPWEYAPAPEATDHIKIRPEYGLFIDNEFSPARPKKTFQVLNPATEEPLAKVAHASKPASTTPLTAYLFADVVRQADLPPGVVNIITGPGEIGMELVKHPEVNKVAFTGSTAVGKMIARATAGTHKKLTLELGGKAANIVFDDAPLDQAIEGIINGIYYNQGEVCCAGSRLFVQENVYEPLLDKLK